MSREICIVIIFLLEMDGFKIFVRDLSPLLPFFVQTVYHQKDILEAKKEAKAAELRAEIEKLQNEERRLLELKEAGLLTPEQREGIKNVRCKMYWAYRIPKGDTKQIKV